MRANRVRGAATALIGAVAAVFYVGEAAAQAPNISAAIVSSGLPQNELSAQPATTSGTQQSEIAVLRYLKIKKGSFPEAYRLSVEGVWPCYERAGARIVAMWQVIYPDMPGQVAKPSGDYDEAYLLTRYASVEHWRATRNQVLDAFCDGADLANMRASLKQRAALTLESNITVLSGSLATNGPYLHVPARTVK